MASSSSSVIEVGYGDEMNVESTIANVSSARIVRVRKALRDSKYRLYGPLLVSIGPFYYKKEELQGMEQSKSEAVLRMQKRIQRNDPLASIKSIVENDIEPRDKEIREFYGEDISYPPKELAWMVTRDACFLLEFLVSYVRKSGHTGEEVIFQLEEGIFPLEEAIFQLEEAGAISGTYDSVFNVPYQDPTREKLIKDIFLFENQIPLWVFKHLLEKVRASTEVFCLLMDLLLNHTTRHKVFMWHIQHPYEKCCHLLEVVYHGMVGANVASYEHSEAVQLQSFSPNSIRTCFMIVVATMKGICGRWCTGPSKEVQKISQKVPTAVELARRGVRIRPVLERHWATREPSCSAIQLIRFDEKTSTLYLPEFRVTPQSDSAMRSIIAMEMSIKGRYHPRPMTQFGIFMDELIDSKEDVDVLRKAEVIKNFLQSNEQVAYLFNSLTDGIAPDPKCKVIHEARMGLCMHKTSKYKNLWSEFVGTYFSKPWLAASTIGAVLLLLMTAAQVVCLFFTCNP